MLSPALRSALWLLLAASLAGAAVLVGTNWFFRAGAGGGVESVPEEAGWRSFGGPGTDPGRFHQPRGITVMPDGTLVVADRAARMQHLDAEGRPLRLWMLQDRPQGMNPKGLCALPGGTVLVCDTHYGRLLEMTVEGEVVKIWGEYGTGPAQFVHPLSCAVDAARGAVYVVEYHGYNDRVQKFTLDGRHVKCWGGFGSEPGQFRRPSGVAVDDKGRVYVADACNHRIQKFDSEGRLLQVFGSFGQGPGEFNYPYDIAWVPDGRLYIADYYNNRVCVYRDDGNYLEALGGPGTEAGKFRTPWSLTVDPRGRLLVSDTGNHRVQTLRIPWSR